MIARKGNEIMSTNIPNKENIRIATVDIGGTCIKSGLWEDGTVKDIREQDTEAHRGGAHVMEKVLKILDGYHNFQAIGISSAGQVDTEKGMILYANENIPGYTGTRIREMIENKFHVPAAVLNDVNSAALGEARYGAGKGHDNFLCLTYGTGVGGAIVMGGQVYVGSGYSAGEFGGIVTHPEDRNPALDMCSGCYERYASTTALVQRVRSRFPELNNGREIFARLGDSGVRELITEWIAEIVCGLISLTHIFNPSLIILGGGVMEQEYVIGEVRRMLQTQLIPSFLNVEILPAALGNVAGMLGAAEAALKEYEKRKEQSKS